MVIPVSVPSLSLQGKVAIITGGATGIGRGITLEFAKAGATVVVAARTVANLEKIAKEVKDLGGRCSTIPTDVSKKADVENMAKKAMGEFGHIDVLVNNAGVGSSLDNKTAPPWLLDIPEWKLDSLMDINLKGTWFCCQVVGKIMVEQKSGNIVNISSVGGLRGDARPYGATKAGVIRVTTGLAKDLAPHNVRVKCIAPGAIKTPAGVVTNESEWEAYNKPEIWQEIVPLQRVGEPVDIAAAVLFLASDAANYVTGQTLTVDGGWLLVR